MSNEWALKMLAELPSEFFGSITFEVRAGEVRKIIKSESHLPPDVIDQKHQAAAHAAAAKPGVVKLK